MRVAMAEAAEGGGSGGEAPVEPPAGGGGEWGEGAAADTSGAEEALRGGSRGGTPRSGFMGEEDCMGVGTSYWGCMGRGMP